MRGWCAFTETRVHGMSTGMFEHLSSYRNILVTGPHRSGTTICARMIAADTEKRFVIERDIAAPRFKGDTEPDLTGTTVEHWMADNPDTVLQGATCFRWLAQLQRDDLLTVFVERSYEQIRRSQLRYRGRVLDDPADKRRQFDAMRIAHPLIVHYDDLSAHPLFHTDRTGWEPRQIAPDDSHVCHD